MSKKKNALSEEQQAKLIEQLNRRLADAIDLQLQSRQAYWNVKGPHFMALRELFDKVAQGVEEYANLIAEHIVQLGGTAEGTAQAVARLSPTGIAPIFRPISVGPAASTRQRESPSIRPATPWSWAAPTRWAPVPPTA